MVEFKHYKGIGKDNEEIELTMASGPVIVEDGKVLLDKEGNDGLWKFPGGSFRDYEGIMETAKREAREELGIDVELSGEPCVFAFDRDHKGVKEYVLLIHYLAKRDGEIKKGKSIKEFKWIDVNNLPEHCAPNIEPVLRYFKVI